MKRNVLTQYLIITASCALYAVGFNWMFDPNHISVGGFTGLGQIINYLLPGLPIGTIVIILNVPLFVLGWRFIGKDFLFSSVYATAVSSLMIDGLAAVHTFKPMEPILACLYGGVIIGVSCGIMLREGATTGGTELAARLLKLKLESLSIGTLCLAIDILVTVTYALIFRDLTRALYGMISLSLISVSIDKVVYGPNAAKVAYIISDCHEELTRRLLELDRGVTLLQGKGAYSGKDKQVILCACARTQIIPVKRAVQEIERELAERKAYFEDHGKLIEAQRIDQRTRYDVEMMRELGYCTGIENYSRVISGREPGSPPTTLLDYFPEDFVLFVDESHVTLPQVRAMYNGDRARKESLVEYGFRLPCAYDNRPLKFPEFEERFRQAVFVSATPGEYEREGADQIVEQVIRPTGLLDPRVEVRPVTGQIDDLVEEIRVRAARDERVLVTTLTKRMAEDLTDHMKGLGLRVRYMHSDIATIQRMELIRDLRLGEFDVLVGINLLREGLDLPEVSMVAILDADKEGFLRSETSLIQTIGRAARNAEGLVVLYADTVTPSMRAAITETERRRKKQDAYNKAHGIVPQTIRKSVRKVLEISHSAEEEKTTAHRKLTDAEREATIRRLEKEMKEASKMLEFEYAALLRDQIIELRGQK